MTTVIPTSEYYILYKEPPQSLEEQARDLAYVVAQYSNNKVSAKFQEICDKKFEKLFQIFLESRGKSYNVEYYEMLLKSLVPIILEIKNFYNCPRPGELASIMGVNFKPEDLKSANSPSYPSGHTIQAYVVAKMLSDQFPEHEKTLLKIAEMVAQSRIDRGVHFLSDIENGKEVAETLYRQIKENLGGETPEYRLAYDIVD